jgi:hypothetical protein
MSTDLERVLREGMERFTSDVEMPAGLARKAYRQRRKRRRAGLALVAGATAVAAGVAVAVVAGGPGASGPGGREPRATVPWPGKPPHGVLTAAYVLGRAAYTAASSRQPVPRPGQYIYVSSVESALAIMPRPGDPTAAWLATSKRWIWLSVDGRKPGLLHEQVLGPKKLPWGPPPPAFTGSRDEWDPLSALSSERGTYTFLTTLPTDPVLLRAWIYGHLNGQQPADEQAWTDIGDMLRETLVPPRLAAALFQVAATIPGATVVPHASDAAGRPGIAVARTVSELKASAELIFGRHTYQLLGERMVLTSPVKGQGPPGTVIEATAQLSATVADHLPGNVPTGSPAAG